MNHAHTFSSLVLETNRHARGHFKIASIPTLIMNDSMQSQSPVFSMILRRCAALGYDGLLLIALYFVVTAVVVLINDGEAVDHPLFYLFLYLLGFVFFRWFWQHGGQTLGMQAWGVKLVNDKPGPVSTFQCLNRYLSGSFGFGVCYLWMYRQPRGRALQDRLSQTLIVRK